jgi:hypothetical protein
MLKTTIDNRNFPIILYKTCDYTKKKILLKYVVADRKRMREPLVLPLPTPQFIISSYPI